MGARSSHRGAGAYQARPISSIRRAFLAGASIVALGAVVSPGVAFAAEPAPVWVLPESAKSLLAAERLTGDWGGLRTKLEDSGITIDLTQTMDILGNLSGGVRRGGAYDGVFEAEITADLEKLWGWKGGTLYASGYVIQGHGLSTYYLENLLTITSVEADPAVRLAELWLQQSLFDDKVKIKVGQILADQNFVISDTAGLFVNSTFGFPGSFGTDLPNGGPAYPLATPGAQIIWQPTDAWLIQAAIFNGNPLGNGTNPHGLDFPLGDGYFAIAEVGYTYTPEGKGDFQATTVKVGGWYNSEDFDSLNRSANGWPVGMPQASDDPWKDKGNYALYALIDTALWTEPGTDDQGLRGFARFTISPQSDRNQINWYADGGLTYTGIITGRDADVFGVAFAYANISPSLADATRIGNFFGSAPFDPIPDYEAVLEITYQAAVAPWLSVQPFFQYVFNPGGNVANPNSMLKTPIQNAAVIGTRIGMTF